MSFIEKVSSYRPICSACSGALGGSLHWWNTDTRQKRFVKRRMGSDGFRGWGATAPLLPPCLLVVYKFKHKITYKILKDKKSIKQFVRICCVVDFLSLPSVIIMREGLMKGARGARALDPILGGGRAPSWPGEQFFKHDIHVSNVAMTAQIEHGCAV